MEGASTAEQGGGTLTTPAWQHALGGFGASGDGGGRGVRDCFLFAISYIIPPRAARRAMTAALLLPWGSEQCFYTVLPKSCPSDVTRGNPQATMPSQWGFPFPLSPSPPEVW